MRIAVPVAAWVEIIAGLALLAAPATGVKLLLDAEAGATGLVMVRSAGIAILSLGIASLPRRQSSALLLFNVGVAVLLALAGLTGGLGGPLLWPAVLMHAALVVALGGSVLTGQAAIGNGHGGNR